MKTSILTENDCCKKVTVEYSPSEWLISNKALMQFIKNKQNHSDDIKTAKVMYASNLNFIEKGEDDETYN